MRYLLLVCMLLGLVASSSSAAPPRPLPRLARVPGATPRNVVVILTDDHRSDFMGFVGKLPWLQTPNLDRLRQQGAHLPNAYVTTSLCSPSRASILTGQYSHVHKVVDNISPVPAGTVYFPQYLQQAGYQTAFLGKWHMGEETDAPQPGFGHWESFPGQGVYYNPTLNINGRHVEYKDSTYITDLLTEHALGWLKARDKKKPFLLYLSHKAVHSPLAPARRHRGRYRYQPYPLPPTYWQTLGDDWKTLGWPEWVKQQRYSWHGVDYAYHEHGSMQELVQAYCETLLAVDESVGAVLDYLQQEGLDKNTLVLYLGDNGFSFGEHGLIDKRQFYEESAKIPLLMACPALFKGGQTVPQLVQNTDLAPTILAAAGLQAPAYMPGRSLLPLLQSPAATPWRDRIFYEYYWEYDFPMTPTVFGVRTGRYKYIRYHGIWDTNELYDLQQDPHEMVNLIARPEYAALAQELAGQLFDWLQRTDGMSIPLKRTIKQPFGDYRHPLNY